MTYSVAIPAYNAAETIEDALESVIAQTCKPAEIIVVNDGSNDNTAEIASSFSDIVRVINQSNKGCGEATNVAIRASNQKIVATLDADDIWGPEKIERQLKLLGAAQNKCLVFARHRLFQHGSDDFSSGSERPGLTRSDLIFHKESFEEIGDIIDQPGGRGEMVDWLARAREQSFKFEIIEDVLVYRRIIEGSLSYGRDPQKDRGYLAVAYQAIQRRKQRNGG